MTLLFVSASPTKSAFHQLKSALYLPLNICL